ncbi:MAG TPA: hypothetical protein VHQ94_03950 [Pyrinomonadaceae bacterium]|nr:hypothetical protein [Pyrinomonadaceae bacterium]
MSFPLRPIRRASPASSRIVGFAAHRQLRRGFGGFAAHRQLRRGFAGFVAASPPDVRRGYASP